MSGPGERPLHGKRVLITRAEADSGPLRARLEALGATVLSLPVVAYEPADDSAPLDRALRRLNDYDWIAFPSRNAVRAVFEGLRARWPEPVLPAGLRLAAVGPATAAEVEKYGGRVDCLPARATAAALAEQMRERGVRGARVLLPQGDIARPNLAAGLREAGARVEEIVVYRTVLPGEAAAPALGALIHGRVDVVALASPSAVQNLAAMLGREVDALRRVRLACIGPTTAQAVREIVGGEPTAVAAEYNLEGLVGAVIEASERGEGMDQSDAVGVLLMAYGSPNNLDEVEPYYTHIRGGRKPSPELLDELKERYRLVGGRTPLLDITASTARELESQLNAGGDLRYRVFLGMKHWHPYIEHGVAEMARAGVRRAVGLVLAPHYSRMSIAGYYSYIDKAQEKLGSAIEILPIESWHLHQPYLDAVARRVRDRLAAFPPQEPVTVVFTAHSLPERIMQDGDPYPQQLRETSEALAQMLGLVHWTFSYQSAGRTADPWLGPDLVDTVNTLADGGVRNILVAPIGFVSDHLEILYDIDHEARQAAGERGVRLMRTESLNASPDFVAGLADLVRNRVRSAPASVG